MASYFDLPPQEKAAAGGIQSVPEKERKRLGGSSLLSPAVTQLLEDLGEADSDSDSKSEEGSLSEGAQAHKDKSREPPQTQSEQARSKPRQEKSTLSPLLDNRSPVHKSSHGKSPSGSSKPKQPHMARFHSLRSMLFTSNVENKLDKVKQEEYRKKEAADTWKNEHDQRQMTRPRTPEKDSTGKEKMGSRLKSKIRRITSKDVPTLDTLKEDGAPHDFSSQESTASSDAENERDPRKYCDTDEESINHSDVEDLVRWVSRRDPPSDGEARANKAGLVGEVKEDSGHESLGHSDVEDLVRWVSRKPAGPEEKPTVNPNYSDASTEDDSELDRGHDSSEEEDPDDLVRWISHRDGPNAGPVWNQHKLASDADSHISYDSDVPELGRWIKRHDGTSGESAATTPTKEVDDPMEEVERGRPRSRDRPSSRQARNHITNDDIGDLVRWVSRNDFKEATSLDNDACVKVIRREEEAKQQAIGMSVDEGSLSQSDVKDLLEHVQSANISATDTKSTIQISSDPPRPGAGESGVLRRENTAIRDSRKVGAQEHLQKSRSDSQQIDPGGIAVGNDEPKVTGRNREGSLKHDDVDELVRWVSQKT